MLSESVAVPNEVEGFADPASGVVVLLVSLFDPFALVAGIVASVGQERSHVVAVFVLVRLSVLSSGASKMRKLLVH